MGQKKILIIGAGKIGRGFIADIYSNAGYLPVFADVSEILIRKMNQQQKYTLLKTDREGISRKVISDYKGFHLSDKRELLELADEIDIIAIAVFSETYPEIAKFLADFIECKVNKKNDKPLNLVICANEMGTAEKINEILTEAVKSKSDEVQDFVRIKTGFVDTLAIRMSVNPPEEYLKTDELSVLTNGYPDLFFDKKAWKGELPVESGMVGIDDIKAGEDRKLFTYNMLHALLAYWGKSKGFSTVADSINDNFIYKVAEGALEEVAAALETAYGFSPDEMRLWNENVIKDMKNPYLKDSVERVGGNPVRKLSRADRLVGPALLCRTNGILPFFITSAIAKAFDFKNIGDDAANKIQKDLSDSGIKQTAEKYCELKNDERDFLSFIVELYEMPDEDFDWDKIKILKESYRLGFFNEKTYKGCAQCLLQSLGLVSGKVNKELYQSASGLSGGTAITGDGSCGGYIGSVLFMGQYAGRRLEFLSDGDKEEQYKSYEMAQQFHDRFEKAYGSILCSDVHNAILGQAFNLRTPEVREKFEAAGAHKDKCTTVIANSSMWAAELLIDWGFWNKEEILKNIDSKGEKK